MKKLLIPTLLAVGATPFISLVSCGQKPEPTPEAAMFKVLASASMIDARNATIQLDWTPEENSITFGNDFSFTYNSGKKATVKVDTSKETRPLSINLNFSEDIKNDITDGILSFHYVDNTAGVEEDASIKDIKIYVIKKINFNECDWSDIGDACAKLETGQWEKEKFLARFTVDGNLATDEIESMDVTSFDDFIGQKRYVYLNGSEEINKHKVIVVDCNADTIDGANVKAAFTFQFKNLISAHGEGEHKNGCALLTCWNDDEDLDVGNRDYWHSTLENALNGDGKVEWWIGWSDPIESVDEQISVYKMIEKQEKNDGLSSYIKEVNRSINIYDDSLLLNPKYDPIPQGVKLFCPTLSNYFSNKGIRNSEGNYITAREATLYCDEGQPHDPDDNAQYKYYSQESLIGDKVIVDSSGNWSTFEQLQMKSSNGEEAFSYFLPSPYLNVIGQSEGVNVTAWHYYVGSDYGLPPHAFGGNAGVSSVPGSVAPCFCI